MNVEDRWQEALQGTVAAAVAMVPDGLVLLTSLVWIWQYYDYRNFAQAERDADLVGIRRGKFISCLCDRCSCANLRR